MEEITQESVPTQIMLYLGIVFMYLLFIFKALAGFEADGTDYFLERDLLNPPEELCKQIFPNLEHAETQIKNSLSANKDDKTQDKKNLTEWAGLGFVSLIRYMRTVILQDAAIILQDKTKYHHFIFNNEVRFY